MQATEWTGFKITSTELSGPKSEKKLAGPGPGQNFVFRFGPGRTQTSISLSGRAEIFFFTSGRAEIVTTRAEPGQKNPARAEL